MRLLYFIVLIFSFNAQTFSQLVMPGDNADPSVVKVGDTYWASATTSNWMPAYPIYKSKDLINWETEGFVFLEKPDWADYYFWAPEISYDNGKYYIYYSAHKRGGNLCLGIASADKPEGPYKDHGPMMCEEAGSIDAFPIRDKQGKLYLIWKEDGNSVGKPTPIWIMEMNEERTALIGEKRELFRNDKPWEANLVEGVSIIENGGYYYAFYAGAGCCGGGCTYGTGVARAKDLLGPWEKYDKNPILSSSDSDQWKCPGHGTPVEKDGKYYFLYHAYKADGGVFTGREGLLKEFTFTNDGWIELKSEDITTPNLVPPAFTYEFDKKKLGELWQWSVFQEPEYTFNNGKLVLSALPDPAGTFLGHKTFSLDYSAEVSIYTPAAKAKPGLGVIGDENNLIAVSLVGKKAEVWQLKDKQVTKLAEKTFNKKDKISLKVDVTNGKDLTFSISSNGKKFDKINPQPIDGAYLPPWDIALRVGLISKGNRGEKAVFEKFELKNKL